MSDGKNSCVRCTLFSDAERLGIEPWEPSESGGKASLATVLLRTLVDTNPDIVGGALDLLEQDLDLLAASARADDVDAESLSFAIFRAARRVSAVREIRQRILRAAADA